jgi:hypothetical protein
MTNDEQQLLVYNLVESNTGLNTICEETGLSFRHVLYYLYSHYILEPCFRGEQFD